MEEKLVTLAILTYSKAQILKTVLENEGIDAYIHNVNQIQPVVSSGVRLRIKESDLPPALKIIESSTWLSENIIGEKEEERKESRSNIILIPVDFSNYSMKASELGFKLAKLYKAEIVFLHAYFTPIYTASLPYGDVFNYQIPDDENVRTVLQKVNAEIAKLSETIKKKIESGEFPDVKFTCILREGIPEDEIIRFAKDKARLILMGTRGKNQKDIDLIGSVTAEVIDRSKIPVLAIPENASIHNLSQKKKFAFLTNFDQRDLITFDTFIKSLKLFDFEISLIHLSNVKDAWDEVKLAGIKEYFQKQYPEQKIKYDVIMDDDLLNNLDEYLKEQNIDIITLPSYKRNIFSRLFNPSIAKKMIFHSDIPLLVMK